jgi:hypothetical protein
LKGQLVDCRPHEEDELRDHLLAGRRVVEPARDLSDRPRVALGGPPHHDRGGARLLEDRSGTQAGRDVPGCYDRDVDEVDELGRQRVIRGPRVHLSG